jgi:GNAT superfamily N-acetyltransferase
LPVYRYILNYGLIYGEVHVTSPDLEGIAVWLPPHETNMPIWKVLKAGAWSLPFEVNPLLFLRFLPEQRVTARVHKRYAPFPHWYLNLLCIVPEKQGKGYGSTLLQSMLARIDCERLPGYLETTEERNVSFYEHHGFRVAETSQIQGTHIKLWVMLRDKAV